MKLSVQEAATLLGRSPRTIRAQLKRGDLSGEKRNGQWAIERRHLPLTEAQRRALQAKAETVRQAVEEALPSRMARTPGQRSRSIADLEAFRRGADLLADVRSADPSTLADETRQRITGRLEQALLALAEAVQHYDRQIKLDALNRARTHLARAVGRLLLETGIPPREPLHGWSATLENEVIPAVAGFARWVDNMGRRRT